MQHTLHLFIGEEMAPIARAISSYISFHGSKDTKDFAHIYTFNPENNNNIYEIKNVINETNSYKIENTETGSIAFDDIYQRAITIATSVYDTSSTLYFCIYIQLYRKEQKDYLDFILKCLEKAKKKYVIDIYGLSNDLAYIFTLNDEERSLLIYKTPKLKRTTLEISNYIIKVKTDNSLIDHFIINQNSNQIGAGLDLDKDTLIRILGEYVILTTEHFFDLYPVTVINKSDVTAFGISSLLFNQLFFSKYLLSHSFIDLLEKEDIGAKELSDPKLLINRCKALINKNTSVLSDFLCDAQQNISVSQQFSKSDLLSDMDKRKSMLRKTFIELTTNSDFNLPERKVLISLLLQEDDNLINDDLLLEELPTLDDCYSEALQLYIDENNKMDASILSHPKDKDGKIYSPLNSLKLLKAQIRRSKNFIHKSESRLETIKDSYKISDDSKNVYNPGEFKFGDTIYHTQRDIIEKPLSINFVPHTIPLESVDFRKNFSKIRNQGNLGACTAFAIGSIFEFILNRHDDSSSHSLSPRFLYYNVCQKNLDNTPIDKGSCFYDIIDSLENDGICKESLCIYAEDFSVEPSEESKKDAQTRLVTRAENVNINHYDITSALSEGYPVAISLKLYHSFHNPVGGFIFRPTFKEINSNGFEGCHAMVICGYSEEKKVYIVRNSWSTKFGDSGYCYIPFSYIDDPALCNQACIISGVNCNELTNEQIIKTNIEFNLECKDIEYASLKILIDEEKQILQKLQLKYNEQYEQYINLISQLTNSSKRNEIKQHALCNGIKIKQPSSEIKDTKNVTYNLSNKKMLTTILVIILLLFPLEYFIPTGISILISIIGIVSIIYLFNKKEVKVINSNIAQKDIESTNNYKILTDIKFTMAAKLIDSIKEIHDDLEKEHRKLTSYINNLTEWRKQEKKKINNLRETLKPPFITILTDDDFRKIYQSLAYKYIDNISLKKEYTTYKIKDEEIKAFYQKLINKIEINIENSYRDFSMCKYMMGESYQFLDYDPKKIELWLSMIENQSKPFVETTTGQSNNNRRLLLICQNEKDERPKWEDFCIKRYQVSPSLFYGNNIYKLTYIQMVDLKKEDVKMFLENNK